MRFREHAVVVLVADVPEHGLRSGDVGTIVHRYDPSHFEVEFTLASGDPLAIVSLPASLLRAPAPTDVTAVRSA